MHVGRKRIKLKDSWLPFSWLLTYDVIWNRDDSVGNCLYNLTIAVRIDFMYSVTVLLSPQS